MTVMWKTFKKIRSRVIDYRSYADNETFRFSLISNLSNWVFVNNDDGLKKFSKKNLDILNSFTPIKKIYAHGNQVPFMTKGLSREIMTRSRLRNKHSTYKTEE